MWTLALAAVLFLAAGCAGRGPQDSGSYGTAADLVGRTFLSTEVKPRQLVAGTRISLAFPKEGQVSANIGCNSLFGTYQVVGGTLEVGQMGSTDMACEQARMDQDQWLVTFLTSKPKWQLDGSDLVLTGKDQEIRLVDRKVAQPDQALTGPTWKIESLLGEDTASSVPGDGQAQLQFEGGKLSGNDGCNALFGKYQVEGDTITFAEIGTTKKACEPERAALERAVLEVLKGSVKYKIDGNRLTLTTGSKGLQLVTTG